MTEKWTIEKDFTFEAAHSLPFHEGKCRRLHGHSYKMTIRVSRSQLSNEGAARGMVVDYYDIKTLVDPLVERCLDHHNLNETLRELAGNTTVENVCSWVYDRLKTLLPGLESVTINETCTARCTYRGIG